MNRQRHTITDLVYGLAKAPDTYHALHVFADDVCEAFTSVPIAGLRKVDDSGLRYTLEHNGRSYGLELFPKDGVLRLSRSAQAAHLGAEQASLAGAAIDTVAAAKRKNGEGANHQKLLGLLVGNTFGNQPNAPRRVFTWTFEPSTREWEAYDGWLVPWMKRELLPRTE